MPELINDGCPFCLQSGRRAGSMILRRRAWAYLVVEYSQKVPGTLQLVPYAHEMSLPRQLAFLWSAFWLGRYARRVFGADFNVSMNVGANAGQTLPHVHVWLIPRRRQYAGKGLAHYVALEARVRHMTGRDLEQLVDG